MRLRQHRCRTSSRYYHFSLIFIQSTGWRKQRCEVKTVVACQTRSTRQYCFTCIASREERLRGLRCGDNHHRDSSMKSCRFDRESFRFCRRRCQRLISPRPRSAHPLRRRRAITESLLDREDPSPGRRGLTLDWWLRNRDGPAPRAPQACHCHEMTAAREFSFQAASHESNARGRGVSGGSTA